MSKKETETSYNPITEGNIWKELLRFYFPILFGTLFQTLYNTADAVVVGRFVGKEALSAVGGSTSSIINLLIGFFVGVSSGASVIIAQRFGAKDEEGTSKAIHTAAALSIMVGIGLTIVGMVIARPALIRMHTPEDVLPYAVTYMRIYFGGVLFNVIYNVGASVLRALGDSKRPLYFLITCSVVNIVLDLIFVVLLRLEIVGVASATVLSQFICAIMVIVVLLRGTGSCKLEPAKIRVHKEVMGPLLRIGIPSGLQSSMFGISNLLIQRNINGFGTDVVAAWTAFNKLDNLFWMTISGFGISVTTFVGQNLGAKRLDRVYKSIHTAIVQCSIGLIFLTIPVLVFRKALLGMFTTDPLVVDLGVDMMMVMVPFYLTYVLVEIMPGAMRGAGDSFAPMVITCTGICVLRVIWLYTAVPIFHSYITVALSYPITWVVTSAVYFIYYKSRKWLRNFSDLLEQAKE